MVYINKRLILRCILLILIALTLAFIWSNSLENADESSNRSGKVIEVIKPIVDPMDKIDDDLFVNIVRKFAHLSEFALLGAEVFLFTATFSEKKRLTLPCFFIPVLASFAAAVTDELLQLTSVGRSCEIKDMLIDLCGIILGTLFVCGIRRLVGLVRAGK